MTKTSVDKTINEIKSWTNSIKNSANFKVRTINLDQASDWSLENGCVHHFSNRFFKVVGVKFERPDGSKVYQPLLEQREIGTLGFIWRNINSVPELLIQAKIEPGNIGIVQIAPSCQATESNADRVHGGDISPFSDLFDKNQVNVISSSLQSEQGSRFLGKLNRNVLATFKNNIDLNSNIHKWVSVDEVLKMLNIDYLLNTDARSVLVCSDWENLTGRRPFSLNNSLINNELFESFHCDGLFKTNKQIKADIYKLREKTKPPEIIPLRELAEYKVNKYGVFSKNKRSFSIKYIDVQTKYREVPNWNQPIIESNGPGKVNLICARMGGILHFLFKPIAEPGLVNKIELSPSEVIEPGKRWPFKNRFDILRKVLIQSWQSDEGGRFYQDKSLYSIIDIGGVIPVPEGWVWMSLKQIRYFLNEGGWLTNESRSALSLLLNWL